MEHPAAQEDEPHRGGEQIGRDENRQLDQVVRGCDGGVQDSEGTAGNGQGHAEHEQSFDVVAGQL